MIKFTSFSIRKFMSTTVLVAGFLFVSQNLLAQNVSLNFKDSPLKSVLKEIQKQTGYTFVYNDNLIQSSSPVSVKV
ncbi:MAG: hypothetical protein WCX48_11370, partial [Bacteroidales bacterium]